MRGLFKVLGAILWTILCLLVGAVGFTLCLVHKEREEPGFSSRKVQEIIDDAKADE